MYSYRRPIKLKPMDVLASARVRLGHAITNAERLTVSHRDPESFHVQKNELLMQLRQLACELERAR